MCVSTLSAGLCQDQNVCVKRTLQMSGNNARKFDRWLDWFDCHSICVSFSLPFYLSVCHFFHPSFCLSICLCICLSVCVCLYISSPLYQYIKLSFLYQGGCLQQNQYSFVVVFSVGHMFILRSPDRMRLICFLLAP